MSRARMPLLLAAAIATLLAGCVPSFDSSDPSLPPTSAPTRTAEPTPTPTETQVVNEFTHDGLTALCVSDTTVFFSTTAVLLVEEARVEKRAINEQWLVYIPATDPSSAIEIAALCIYGGTPDNVDKFTYGGTAALSDERISELLLSDDTLGRP